MSCSYHAHHLRDGSLVVVVPDRQLSLPVALSSAILVGRACIKTLAMALDVESKTNMLYKNTSLQKTSTHEGIRLATRVLVEVELGTAEVGVVHQMLHSLDRSGDAGEFDIVVAVKSAINVDDGGLEAFELAGQAAEDFGADVIDEEHPSEAVLEDVLLDLLRLGVSLGQDLPDTNRLAFDLEAVVSCIVGSCTGSKLEVEDNASSLVVVGFADGRNELNLL